MTRVIAAIFSVLLLAGCEKRVEVEQSTVKVRVVNLGPVGLGCTLYRVGDEPGQYLYVAACSNGVAMSR